MSRSARNFEGTAFLQILDLRNADLFTDEGLAYAFENARDPDGLEPAASVVIVKGTVLKQFLDDFYHRPERPVYPVAYRRSCSEAIMYFVEQGLVGDVRAKEWRETLRELLKDRESEV